MSEKPLITYQNLRTEAYIPEPGVRYEVADGCIRTLKRPFIEVDEEASRLIQKDKELSFNPDDEHYSPRIRIEVMKAVTDGDPIPETGIDLQVVGRVVADFFTFRIPTGAKPPASSA